MAGKLEEHQLLEIVDSLSEQQGEKVLNHIAYMEEELGQTITSLDRVQRALSAERLEFTKVSVALEKATAGWQPEVTEMHLQVQAVEGKLRHTLVRESELESELKMAQQMVADLEEQLSDSGGGTSTNKEEKKSESGGETSTNKGEKEKKKARRDPARRAAIDSQLAKARAWQDSNLEPAQVQQMSTWSKVLFKQPQMSPEWRGNPRWRGWNEGMDPGS